MSASQFLSHFLNSVTSFPNNPTKFPTHFIIVKPSKSSFIALSTSPPSNGSNAAEIEGGSVQRESEGSYTKSSETIRSSVRTIKAPTAPWMNEPLLVKPNEILEFGKRKTKRDFQFGRKGEHPDADLTGKVGGGKGKLAMKKIFKGIEKLEEMENSEEPRKNPENVKFKFAGQLCGNEHHENVVEIEVSSDEAVQCISNKDECEIPLTEIEKEVKLKTMPWERDEKTAIIRVKKEKVVTAAELSLDQVLLERLRSEAATIRKWVKVKKAGVTQAVVDQVKYIWRNNELALLKFDIPLCQNMDRAREIVEMKTKGVVVWINKDFLAVYRGCNYRSCSKHIWSRNLDMSDGDNDQWESLHTKSLYVREADRLLDGLGPPFIDWWMQKPLPVDGDLLPETVCGFKTPFRRCPPFTRSKLTDSELTYLRKLARPLPFHFVLGRNRKLQGLAAAILKLWGKCHIAKIALKFGVPNTDNEQMAFELKKLTGGVLLLRNKFLIILYRGKDFIPTEVEKVVAEREMELRRFQLQEEAARLKASEVFSSTEENSLDYGIVGTLSEFRCINSGSRIAEKEKTEVEVQVEAEWERLKKELKDRERQLFILKKKIEKSAKVFDELKNASMFSKKDPDIEIISEEERACLIQMGLKIDSTLVLGRRGVYDGVIEGMHQHWKHREIVKVITMQKKFSQVMYTAKLLEAESGGILVSVVKLKEGHGIILYRGKNYKRPKTAAFNLLNKKEALSRSLEIQRLGSLKFFANQTGQEVNELKRKLVELSEKRIDCRN